MQAEPDLFKILAVQRAAHKAAPMPDVQVRKERLSRLETALLEWEDRLVEAMSQDFGYRVPTESRLSDVVVPLASIRRSKRKVSRWMTPRWRPTPLHLLPARASVQPVPKGVIGIVSPWNFPVLLSLSPLVDALAAGNRAMIKPSELTSRTSTALATMISETFRPDEVTVVTGGADVAASFTALPFDHLIFTGSTETGRKVAKAAAENLVPVTLELGGKSPAVLGRSGDVSRFAKRVVFSKFLNAGQTCVAPDYILVPENVVDETVTALKQEMTAAFEDWPVSADLTSVLGEANKIRLEGLIASTRSDATEIWQPGGEEGTRGRLGRFAPTLVLRPSTQSALMREEIFGPVLPVLVYSSEEEARAIVAQNPDPLALYIFSNKRDEARSWIETVPSGTVAVNECVIQLVADSLPFGGIGASGYGAYHGRWGFDALSHLKPVFRQSRWSALQFIRPPYGRVAGILTRIFRRLI